MQQTHVDFDDLATACGNLSPADGVQSLVDCVNARVSGLSFRLSLTDSDWYRLGGVITPEGTRIADDLEDWVEGESEGDVLSLMARHGDAGYIATAITGKTHFLTAPTGEGALDFVQIEVEELQEVVDREILPKGWFPETVEDVIDPMDYDPLPQRPLGPPRYLLKDVTFLSAIQGELVSDFGGDPRFRRFLDEWNRSSAGAMARFRDHWVVTVAPYLDTQGNHLQEVKLLSTDEDLAVLAAGGAEDGEPLAALIREIDRKAGFGMAWYFLMINRNFLPYRQVKAIQEDLSGSAGHYGFLPERDLKILERWVEEPYHF